MNTRIIDGNAVARSTRSALAPRVQALAARGVQPGLAVLLVGNDPASRIYVRNKVRSSAEAGFASRELTLPAQASEAEVLARIDELNRDPAIHGILVQLPLPPQVSSRRVLEAIDPEKDVDGFHPINVGLLATGHARFVPCTPAGIMQLLAQEEVALAGRHAVVIGSSNIVGKPMALLLLAEGATVTICHSRTDDLAGETRRADLLVVAAGKANLVGAAMVKPGAVVVDVGINRLPNGKLAGDVDTQSLLGIAATVTPVPGGVGPMTIAMLLSNTVLAAESRLQPTPE